MNTVRRATPLYRVKSLRTERNWCDWVSHVISVFKFFMVDKRHYLGPNRCGYQDYSFHQGHLVPARPHLHLR